jgi:hypothetical protein
MTVNHHFNQYYDFQQQTLLEDLIVETIKIKGMDVLYIPRTLGDEDPILGDDPLSSFETAYQIEMYVESFGGFEDDGDFMTKFGIVIKDDARLTVSKRRFTDIVTMGNSAITYPRHGDLIYFPVSKTLFVIKWVEHENPFYQLGKNYVFTLSVEMFVYSQEDLSTGYDDVDNIQTAVDTTADIDNDPYADNTPFETVADGSADDAFDDDGTDDRGTGIIDFNENDPFGSM